MRNVPFGKVNWKNEEKQQQKPWVTNGEKKSIRQRDKIHKQLLKSKDANAKTKKQILYKNHRNVTVELFKKASRVTTNIYLKSVKQTVEQ